MKKKLVSMLLAAAMAMGLAACGSEAGSGTSGTAGTEASDSSASDAGTGDSGTSDSADADAVSDGADASGTVYKVGIIQYVDDASLNQIEKNIESELDAKSAELGVTFDYADYTFNGQADATTLNQIAAQLISDEVDVIIPIATPTAQIVQAATEDNPIPVVFSAVSDPVGASLVASMDAPGSNITGTSDALNTNTIMDMIFAVDPDADYIGLLYSKSEDASTQAIADAKSYLDAKGVAYIEKTGTTTDEVSSAADALIAEGVDAIFTPTDNTIMTAELAIYEKLADAGIPHYTGADSFALNGAFLGYGVDYANLGVETADMAVEILVDGADPAALGVKTFDNGLATVNTETCEAIGLDIETVKAALADYATQISEIQTDVEFE
jgi:putative ABC transport system substrate-binding protein